ncbi:hypothetical protein ACFW16_24860 [Inquilinus sp. NPDC058860]|uniref:hypothetical protein n=1 Tax=Inquilinus sp. NPDC058860 TaxID=3346652 RepID=UPI0036839A08
MSRPVDPAVVALLRAEASRRGSIRAVADAIGRSRTAVSLALSGKYPASDTSRFEAAVLAALDQVECPFLAERVQRDRCRLALGPCPTHAPHAAAHWRACQTCLNKPQEESSRG